MLNHKVESERDWLQTKQYTHGGAVIAVTKCVETSRPQQWESDLPFFGQVCHADPLDG